MSYRQNILGLEYGPFRDMRDAIGRFIDAQAFGSNPKGTMKLLDAQLEKALELTKTDNTTSDLVRMRDLSLLAANLANSGQAPEFVSIVRGQFSQPNLRFYVGESFVSRAVSRPVNQPSPVDECVLGTRVLGNSMVRGNVLAELMPQYNGVSVRLSLQANFSSNNIGYNRGVKVYTTGYSPVYASKVVTVTPQGTYSQPAVASTNLQTQIHGIDHRFRIVRKIASRKAEEQKPEANAIGQYRLQTRLANTFNDQIEKQLAENRSRGNQLAVLEQDRVEMLRLGVPKPIWQLQSTDSQILADFKEADALQLAAPSRSALPKTNDAIFAELHQSLPINLASLVLAGRTLHSWEMDDFSRQITGSVPEELQKESEGEPWSLTFTDHQPVEIEFDNGVATVTLRILKMSRGDQELPQPASITAKYVPIIAGGELVFQRQGDVELEFVRAPTGLRAVTLRSFLKGKFDRFFRERTEPRRITFPTKIPNVSQLAVTGVTLEDGWAQFTVR